jgi:hypothetical protein
MNIKELIEERPAQQKRLYQLAIAILEAVKNEAYAKAAVSSEPQQAMKAIDKALEELRK